jgi:hypothetical protein
MNSPNDLDISGVFRRSANQSTARAINTAIEAGFAVSLHTDVARPQPVIRCRNRDGKVQAQIKLPVAGIEITTWKTMNPSDYVFAVTYGEFIGPWKSL